MSALREVADLIYGCPFSSSGFRDGIDPEGMPLVRIRDVVPGFSNTSFVGPYDQTFLVDNGDLLIGMDGEFNIAMWRGGRALLNQRVCKVVARPGKVDPRYLYWALPKHLKAIEARTPFVTVKHLSAKALAAVELELPPFAEQRRIADILDKADAIRRKRKEAITLTEELLRSAFLEMFGDPVTNPKGWRRDAIGNLLTLKSGDFLSAKQMDSSGPFAVYGGNGINGRHSGYMFEETMLTIGRVGVYCGAVHRTEPKSWITDNALYVAKFSEELTATYLEYALRVANLNQYASQSAQPLISGGRLAPVELMVPSKPAQIRFASFVGTQSAVRESAGRGGAAAEDLFNSLVARAFSGWLGA